MTPVVRETVNASGFDSLDPLANALDLASSLLKGFIGEKARLVFADSGEGYDLDLFGFHSGRNETGGTP